MSLAKLAHPFTGSLLRAWLLAGGFRLELELDQHGPIAVPLDAPAVLHLGDR